mgnify:CR=1 FL=1|tara:strand:+ start:3541 stop:4059 length:519 start_codon:yes stop_codon:yes gene_type:complete
MSGVSVEAQGLKEIDQMFRQLPKQVSQDVIWGRFWRKVSKPLKEAAAGNVKDAPKDIPYPPDTSLKIRKGTLRESIQFYRTRASKKVYGGYVGPRVKGKFRKNKGGYYGAWVEYGHKTVHGKMTKDNPFMEKAFKSKSGTVLSNGFKDAEKIFVSAVKSHERRLKKYGTLGF